MKERGRGSTFEDLEVYRAAREFRKTMYRVTRGLPDIEKFGLAGQIRTLHSRGSIEELIDDLNVCDDEQYLPVEEIASLKQCGWRLRQLIDGYIRYLRQQKNSGPSSSVRETALTYDHAEELDDDSRISM